MKNSEPIFQQYFTINDIKADYEKLIGNKKPDFSCWKDGHPVAFWDVVDRESTELDVKIRSEKIHSGPSPAEQALKKQIARKSAQFTGCGSCPGMLVFADWNGTSVISPELFASAMHGNLGIQFQIGQSNSDPADMRFSENGKMEPAHKGGKHFDGNNAISAVGYLCLVRTNHYTYGLKKLISDLGKTTWELGQKLDFYGAEEKKLQQQGIDLERELPVLQIYLNSNANNPWPDGLWGHFDQVYQYDQTQLQFVLIRDGLAAKYPIAIPVSESQKDINSIMDLPLFRND